MPLIRSFNYLKMGRSDHPYAMMNQTYNLQSLTPAERHSGFHGKRMGTVVRYLSISRQQVLIVDHVFLDTCGHTTSPLVIRTIPVLDSLCERVERHVPQVCNDAESTKSGDKPKEIRINV
ncbi:hypothetical protein JB92DRAFT_2897129 [Gautieria morchelliformis]|nr:hypothetical protein JB92DRAFT_2897129 [Gautieria morchelliformis]